MGAVPKIRVISSVDDPLVVRPSGAVVYSDFRVLIDDDALPYLVEMRIEVDVDRHGCRELVCRSRRDGAPVTGAGVRKLRVSEMVSAAVTVAGLDCDRRFGKKTRKKSTNELRSILQAAESQLQQRERRAMDDRHLVEVAVICRATDGGPTAEVREISKRLNTSERNAWRWRKVARERGMIP